MSTGVSYRRLAFNFKIADCTISQIVSETCSAIWKNLKPIHLLPPQSENDWLSISRGFHEQWQLTHALGKKLEFCIHFYLINKGSIDGKHIRMVQPANSGSIFYNYKEYNSIVLLGVCDHRFLFPKNFPSKSHKTRYRFTFVDIGSVGHNSDGGVFESTKFKQMAEDGTLHIPEPENLPETATKFGYYFAGDAAFPLETYLMKPYGGSGLPPEKKIFNYRFNFFFFFCTEILLKLILTFLQTFTRSKAYRKYFRYHYSQVAITHQINRIETKECNAGCTSDRLSS